jgi:hypothetical protein
MFFWWYYHPSSGAQTTIPIASGICHIITATSHYCGTGLSLLWVANATHSKLKPVPTFPQ